MFEASDIGKFKRIKKRRAEKEDMRDGPIARSVAEVTKRADDWS